MENKSRIILTASNALCGDDVNPQLLGINGVVGEESVRHRLTQLDDEAGMNWLQVSLQQALRAGVG